MSKGLNQLQIRKEFEHRGYSKTGVKRTKKPFLIQTHNKWGLDIYVAPTRYGKSILARMNVLAEIKNSNRRLLIFDHNEKDEWYNLKYLNMENEHYYVSCLPQLVKVNPDFKFKISDLNETKDWVSFAGISKNGAILISQLARLKDIHMDDFDIFVKMLDTYPITYTKHKYSISDWKEEWGIDDSVYMTEAHKETKDSALKVVNYSFTFWREGDYYVADWYKLLLKYNYIHVRTMHSGVNREKGRLYVGLILKKLAPFLDKLNLIIVAEEADGLIPRMTREHKEDACPLSLRMFEWIVYKEQRRGVRIVIIIQDIAKIDPDVWREAWLNIYAGHSQLNDTSKLLGLATDSLVFEELYNYREFFHIHRGSQVLSGLIFAPLKSPCRI